MSIQENFAWYRDSTRVLFRLNAETTTSHKELRQAAIDAAQARSLFFGEDGQRVLLGDYGTVTRPSTRAAVFELAGNHLEVAYRKSGPSLKDPYNFLSIAPAVAEILKKIGVASVGIEFGGWVRPKGQAAIQAEVEPHLQKKGILVIPTPTPGA